MDRADVEPMSCCRQSFYSYYTIPPASCGVHIGATSPLGPLGQARGAEGGSGMRLGTEEAAEAMSPGPR